MLLGIDQASLARLLLLFFDDRGLIKFTFSVWGGNLLAADVRGTYELAQCGHRGVQSSVGRLANRVVEWLLWHATQHRLFVLHLLDQEVDPWIIHLQWPTQVLDCCWYALSVDQGDAGAEPFGKSYHAFIILLTLLSLIFVGTVELLEQIQSFLHLRISTVPINVHAQLELSDGLFEALFNLLQVFACCGGRWLTTR